MLQVVHAYWSMVYIVYVINCIMFRIDVKQRDSTRIVISSSDGHCSVVISATPFAVDVLCSDELVASINSRSLLRFNTGRAKPR